MYIIVDPNPKAYITLLFVISPGSILSDDDSESVSREASPSLESPRPVSQGSESPLDNIHASVMTSAMMTTCSSSLRQDSKVSGHNFSNITIICMERIDHFCRTYERNRYNYNLLTLFYHPRSQLFHSADAIHYTKIFFIKYIFINLGYGGHPDRS